MACSGCEKRREKIRQYWEKMRRKREAQRMIQDKNIKKQKVDGGNDAKKTNADNPCES